MHISSLQTLHPFLQTLTLNSLPPGRAHGCIAPPLPTRYHYYLYYDANCNGDDGGGVESGWFIANEKPSETKSTSLVGAAGKCKDGGGLVKIRHKPSPNWSVADEDDRTVPRPEKLAVWEVWCNGGWEEDVRLEESRTETSFFFVIVFLFLSHLVEVALW